MSDVGAGILGLFGGTFDPLHVAHLRLAIEAREALDLAEVCFIPAGSPALRAAPHCTAEHRLAMVARALADLPGFSVDASEVLAAGARPGPSYTVETLERLRRQHGPERPLVLLLGADAFARLEAWQRWRELFALAHIAVATRPGHELTVMRSGALHAGNSASRAGIHANGAGSLCVPGTPLRGQVAPLDGEFAARRGVAADLASAPAGRIVTFAITALEISATAIRQRLVRGLSARYLVPDAVLDYIESHQIYRTPHGH
ncbi:MAG: nicotinate (nicotinamide) nucleotide adenylyltransferase [Rhodocyclales bacterium RIFCSPLOWO2_02_FULL_63_24]|nr:MAG: nicotinate (nicotinamide) nucleotide adenylyltransferase [Rhodocyclales bacterium GWA2_65_19]OHC68824.1 MAG: nicotinate (nicotinamide) nucleotide adenylyltransferase [Rhodocyclales bacterium RIFCSPLOWO2_02_FULL_63_24]